MPVFRFRRPQNVHQRPHDIVCVEELDRVLVSISGEVAVVAFDHRQADSHVTGEVEGGELLNQTRPPLRTT
jgi:hypothetical protein